MKLIFEADTPEEMITLLQRVLKAIKENQSLAKLEDIVKSVDFRGEKIKFQGRIE